MTRYRIKLFDQNSSISTAVIRPQVLIMVLWLKLTFTLKLHSVKTLLQTKNQKKKNRKEPN